MLREGEKPIEGLEVVGENEIKYLICGQIRDVVRCNCLPHHDIPRVWCSTVEKIYGYFIRYKNSKIKPATTREEILEWELKKKYKMK